MTFASYLKVDIEEALKKDGIDLQDLVAPIKYHVLHLLVFK